MLAAKGFIKILVEGRLIAVDENQAIQGLSLVEGMA